MRELRTKGLLNGVVSPNVVVPCGLAHDERVAGTAFNRRDPLRKESGRAQLEPIRVLQRTKRILCSRTQHHALAGEVPVLSVDFNERSWHKPIVNPELSRVQVARYVCNVDLPLGIPQTPSLYRKTTADYRLRTRRGLRPGHCVLIPPAVRSAKDKWVIDAVCAANEPHNDVVIAVEFAHRALCTFGRPERMVRSTVGRVIS